MTKEEKEIEKLLKSAQSYFGKDEKIYIFECKKCNKPDPVPSFIIGKQLGFLKFIKAKKSYEMECLYCGGQFFFNQNL